MRCDACTLYTGAWSFDYDEDMRFMCVERVKGEFANNYIRAAAESGGEEFFSLEREGREGFLRGL